MGNRFGVKDFVQIVLLLVLIVSVWLSMKQRDREWRLLDEIRQQGHEQTRDMASFRQLLVSRPLVAPTAGNNGGGNTTAPTTQSAHGKVVGLDRDPFKYIREAQQKPDFARGDWFVDNFGTKVPKLTPLISSDVYQTYVENRVLEQLAYLDPNTLEFLPLLAQSWVAAEDGMTYTFQLRQGVTFSDGEPFSADDVVFTFNWIMNPKVQSPRQKAYYSKIASVEKLGDYEVVFKFKEPYFESFDLAATMTIMPEHFYGQYTAEQFNDDPGLLMGTGPYRLRNPAGWRPGDRIELIRNERYWGEPGPWDRIIWEQVETDAADLTMFKNGEVDVFAAQPEQYELLKRDQDVQNRAQSFEVESSLSGYAYIAWNQKRAGKPTRFADARVRRAMTLLTDRERICKEVMLGYATVASGPFSRLGKPQAAPDVEPWPFDPDQAKSLLKEAGFQDRDRNGVLEDANGVPFEFKLSYPAKSETYERVVRFLKDSYAVAGIKADLDPVDWPIMISKLDNREFDAISLRWTGGPETDIYQMFHSDQMKDNGDNYMSYASAELDKLMEQARSEVDEAKRMPLWQECHRILHRDQPYTFLFNQKALSFVDKRIQNIRPSKLGLNYTSRLNMPNPWYVPKPMQKWTK
jgi:peptide/nickel transport system substrate-binding protein